MSTSDRFMDTRFAKRVVIVNGLVPGALLVWDAYHHQLGVNEVNFAIRTTGLVGLVFIVLSLAVTPVRTLTGWNRLIGVRRNLGVLGFCYLATHVLIFFWFDRQASVVSTLNEIVMRQYLWFGTAAFVFMAPLALTSTDGMVRRLGATRWKVLHRLAYVIAISAAVHYYLLVKADVRQPLVFAAFVAALLVYRVIAHYVDLRKELRAARARVAAASVERPKRKFWSGELLLARIFDETHDVKTFRLISPDGGPLPFTHVAGQYLNLALTIDGTRVNRSYTIASSPTRGAYCEISVKRVPGGYASQYLHDHWREGQRVKASAPAGTFTFAGPEGQRVVLIAGGIGITPLMSVVRSLTDRGWAGEIYLLFSVRLVRDIVFHEELAYLQARFTNLRVRVLVSRDPDTAWDGPRGTITRDVLADFVPNLTQGPVLLCGPAPMMVAMRELLVGLGVPDMDVWQEAFVSRPNPGPGAVVATTVVAHAANDRATPLATGMVANIVFTRAGKTAELPPDVTVLEAAENAGVDIPFECRSGICGQCKTTLVTGEVTMETEDALTAADRSRGLILACQAHALSDIEVNA